MPPSVVHVVFGSGANISASMRMPLLQYAYNRGFLIISNQQSRIRFVGEKQKTHHSSYASVE